MALLLLVRMRTRSCVSLAVLLWKHELSLQPLPYSLSSFLVPSSLSLFLLPSSRAVGSKVRLLPASLLPAWSQERSQGLQREYSQCCVSMFQPSLSLSRQRRSSFLDPPGLLAQRTARTEEGGRAGRESFSCPSQSLPGPLHHSSSSFSQPVSFAKTMKPEKRRSSARSRAQRQARFGWVAVSGC